MNGARVSVVLYYVVPGRRRPVRLAATRNPALAVQAARTILAEAETTAASAGDQEFVLDLGAELEAERLRQILYAVMPALCEDEPPPALRQNGTLSGWQN